MIKVTYVSTLCAPSLLNYLFKTAKEKPEQAAQKFHRLLAEGIGYNDKATIKTLSTIPVTPHNHNRKFWFIKKEFSEHVQYRYIPLINLPFLKNIFVFIYTFINVGFNNLLGIGNKRVVICDALNITVSLAALLACKLTFVKCIGVVTDIPGLIITNIKEDWSAVFAYIYKNAASFVLTSFTGYIMLTEQMNSIVNPRNKPYMIMEGLVDKNMKKTVNNMDEKYEQFVMLYAGGLYEKYGCLDLINAVKGMRSPQARIHLYGRGDMVEKMDIYTGEDERIEYLGIVPNDVIVQEQLKVTMLVNPRPTNEEFTQFSFPSKNMEYMVSGTPMVTTKLPGMPLEYHDFVYLFEDESSDGMCAKLEDLMSKPREELHRFGKKAREFVLEHKNNHIQAERVLSFVHTF